MDENKTNSKTQRILLIHVSADRYQQMLTQEGCDVDIITTPNGIVETFEKNTYDLVVIGTQLYDAKLSWNDPNNRTLSGRQLIETLQKIKPFNLARMAILPENIWSHIGAFVYPLAMPEALFVDQVNTFFGAPKKKRVLILNQELDLFERLFEDDAFKVRANQLRVMFLSMQGLYDAKNALRYGEIDYLLCGDCFLSLPIRGDSCLQSLLEVKETPYGRIKNLPKVWEGFDADYYTISEKLKGELLIDLNAPLEGQFDQFFDIVGQLQ